MGGGWRADKGVVRLVGGRHAQDYCKGKECVGVEHDEMD